MNRVYNFSAGPAALPKEVLERAQAELLDYQACGMSVMELSHRSGIFDDIIKRTEASLRALMLIPENYHVLFLQGGATLQFSMVPLNMFSKSPQADFIDTGNWSKKAIAEAKRYGTARVVASSSDKNFSYIPEVNASMFSQESAYVHITTNNTIFGTLMHELPQTGDLPLVADMSSNILSQEYRVEDFGIIYAGAQKNIGPAGLTIVIIREDLVGNALPITPLMLDYKTHVDKHSMYNTPPTFAIYMASLVFDWTLKRGGVKAMAERNEKKAALLYNFLDKSPHFQTDVRKEDRSIMNVCFRLATPDLDKQFIAEADRAGFKTLKGHRVVGGMRASIYNPMPEEGVSALIEFMADFESRL